MTTTVTHDRHERPPDPVTSPLRHDRGAVLAMATGAVLTVLAMAALVVDLMSTGVLGAHLREVYAGYAEPPGEGVVAAYLFTLGSVGVLGWLWTIRAVRQERRWARPLATVLFVVALLIAVAHLTVSEYGSTILPPEVGLVNLVLCVPGFVAVARLWRAREGWTTVERGLH